MSEKKTTKLIFEGINTIGAPISISIKGNNIPVSEITSIIKSMTTFGCKTDNMFLRITYEN